MPSKRVKRLQNPGHNRIDGEECPVCYDFLYNDFKAFPCAHLLCNGCFAKVERCPLCRIDKQGRPEHEQPPPPPPPRTIGIVHVNERGVPLPAAVAPDDFFTSYFQSEFINDNPTSRLRVRVLTDSNVPPAILNFLIGLTRNSASGSMDARVNGYQFHGTVENVPEAAPEAEAAAAPAAEANELASESEHEEEEALRLPVVVDSNDDEQDSPLNFSVTLV